MTRPLLAASVIALAALSALPAGAQRTRSYAYQTQTYDAQTYGAQARGQQSFDGFCYVRENSVRAGSETDYWGTRRGYGRCYHGEYYVYSSGPGERQRAAPRAPDGYVVRYFTRRPDQAFYDRLYNAASLTENFAPEPRYDNRYDNHYSDRSRYDPPRPNEYPAEETESPRPRVPVYDKGRDEDEDYSADQATVGRYEQSAPSDDYARDSHRPDADGYIAPYDARPSQPTLGWQDDQGAWHLGRPRAIGWQDEYGQWHVGEVQSYGWRDRNGQWHETQDDGQ